MLQNIVKSALMAATICLLGNPSGYAFDLSSGDVQITGRAGSYWGQATDNNEHSTTEDAVSHFQNTNEMNLRFVTLHGAFLGYMELEARSHATTGSEAQAKNLAAVQTFISFMPSRSFDVTFGSLLDLEYSSFAVGSGLASFSAIPTYQGWETSLYTEGDGIKFRYKHPKIKAGLSLYSTSAGSTNGLGRGTATNVFAGGKYGPLEFRASSISETGSDNQTITSDDAGKTESKSTFVGARFSITPEMSISLDTYSSEIEFSKNLINKNSSMALQARVKKIGPGNIVFTYATTTHKNDSTAAASGMVFYATSAAVFDFNPTDTVAGTNTQFPYTFNQKVEISDLGLIYELPMADNGSRLQIFYMNKTIKASDPLMLGTYALATEFTRIQSQIGAGVWLNF